MSAVIALAAGGRIVGVEGARMAIVFFVDVCHAECWDVKLERDVKIVGQM